MDRIRIIGLGNMGLGMAKRSGVPMFTTSSAYEMFQAGMSLDPEEDNWTVIKLLGSAGPWFRFIIKHAY